MRGSSLSSRRNLLKCSGIALAGLLTGHRRSDAVTDLDAFIRAKMDRDHIPGLAVAILKDRQTVWSKGFGWADIDGKVEMTLDTLQNIGSISKTFVGTAVMQLRERKLLQLEDDVNKYLNFSLRNPGHPQSPITFSDLMLHRSSIADGSAYARGYACGDPAISLEEWIRGYFLPGGAFHDPKENFHPWAPGERREYNNVAFGLLARLVEVISGMSFGAYCRTRIFRPLGMDETSWYLADVKKSRQAIPYSYVSSGSVRGPSWGGSAQGVIGAARTPPVTDGYAPNCLYNHPNFPDGFLRTSVHQLARYLIAYLTRGSFEGRRILSEESVNEMLRSRYAVSPELNQGLVWIERLSTSRMWGHTGGDPGINTLLSFNRSSGNGVIVFANTWGAALGELEKRLFQEIGTL